MSFIIIEKQKKNPHKNVEKSRSNWPWAGRQQIINKKHASIYFKWLQVLRRASRSILEQEIKGYVLQDENRRWKEMRARCSR